jgi:orotate phosphoribosyltransferase
VASLPLLNRMDDRQRLFDIIGTRSFRQGGAFRLASGRMSTIYFNLKPTMLDGEGARLIGAAVAAKAAALDAELVGGLELGAVPIVASAAAMSAVAGRPLRAVIVRKAAKEHGTQSLVEGLAQGETLEGRAVLVVEDVTTTGGSALKAIAALREAGAQVRHVVTVVDREEGAASAFAAADATLHALFTKREFAREADHQQV